MLVLLADPHAQARIRSQSSLLGSVVSETIRLEPAIPVLPRTTTASLRIDDHEIPAGSMLLLCSATANRDPATWS